MNYKIFPIVLFLLFSFTSNKTTISKVNKSKTIIAANLEKSSLDVRVETVYNSLYSSAFSLPKLDSFTEALKGFYLLRDKGLIQKNILTLIDFSLPSSSKRLWIIDLSTNTILYNSVVSHGMKSGGGYATSFSNSARSNKSSLGFYSTAESYIGKNGLSLKLDGLEKGVNDNARARAIVIHGANYANPSILNSQNYLGRSQGCPAIPQGLTKQIINTIKNKSCLFIYHPSRNFKIISKLVS